MRPWKVSKHQIRSSFEVQIERYTDIWDYIGPHFNEDGQLYVEYDRILIDMTIKGWEAD